MEDNLGDLHDLKSFAENNMLERAAIPKEINIIKEMPLSPIGKVLRNELKILEIKMLINELLIKLDL